MSIKKWTNPIIDRYLFKEFTGPFLFSLGGFIIIGLVDLIFALVDLFVNSGVSLGIITRLLLYKIPAIMIMFLPMSAIFATMLMLVRMAKDNELTIIRTSGIPIFRIIIPVALMGICVTIFSWGVNEYVTPWANRVSDHLIRTTIQKNHPPKLLIMYFLKKPATDFYTSKMSI